MEMTYNCAWCDAELESEGWSPEVEWMRCPRCDFRKTKFHLETAGLKEFLDRKV